MIIVCSYFETRLDKVWWKLQMIEQVCAGTISQVDLDEACVNRLESFVDHMARNLVPDLPRLTLEQLERLPDSMRQVCPRCSTHHEHDRYYSKCSDRCNKS